MNKISLLLIFTIVLAFFTARVNANCMERAQEFKCTYNMLKCTDGDNGECECEDKSVCKWTDGIGDENCPCKLKKIYIYKSYIFIGKIIINILYIHIFFLLLGGAKNRGPRRRRRRIHSDM